jgi:hypothetical protein
VDETLPARGRLVKPHRMSGGGLFLFAVIRGADTPTDLADASLVDMASDYQTGRILTLDRDFRIHVTSRSWSRLAGGPPQRGPGPAMFSAVIP